MADASVSKTDGRKVVRVRVPLSVPQLNRASGRGGMVDAHGSGPCLGNEVEVRLLSTAPLLSCLGY